MKWRGWERLPVEVPDPADPSGKQTVSAIAPVIVSASRSTDIPAFYGDWFSERLKAGYVRWKSPFGGSPVIVSFQKTRLFVFWSKNPAPFFPHLDRLDRLGYSCYFLYTLNDYDDVRLEPNVPPVDERVRTFMHLSKMIGKGRVVWRFDPLILTDTITVDELLDRVKRIGDCIAPFTERLVFSFVDIEKYAKVRRNLNISGYPRAREFTGGEVAEFCEGIQRLNGRWGLTVTACADRRDLSQYGIGRGQCISYDLMATEFSHDAALMAFLCPEGQRTLDGDSPEDDPSRHLKDPGQRNACRCIVSKDIGQYSTCMHLCAYCYANTSPAAVRRNYLQYLSDREHGVFHDTIAGR